MSDQNVTHEDSQVSERDLLTARIRSRIAQFVRDCDPGLVASQEAAAEIGSVQRLFPEAPGNAGDLETVKWAATLAWLRYIVLPPGPDRSAFGVATGLFDPVYEQNPDAAPPPLHPLYAAMRAHPEVGLPQLCQRWYDAHTEDKDRLLSWSVDALSVDDRFRSAALANLALRLTSGGGAQARLDVAIDALRRSIALATDTDQAARLSNLAGILQTRYQASGQADDLDEAIGALHRAVGLGDPERLAGHQSNLSGALQRRFMRSADVGDLEQALTAAQQATTAVPGTAMFLHNLGCAQLLRYGKTGQRADLDQGVATEREALAHAPPDGPVRAAILSELGVGLRARSDRTDSDADLTESIAIQRQAITQTPDSDQADKAIRLNSLGTALGSRYERTKELADLTTSIGLYGDAVRAAPPSYPHIGLLLSNYGGAVRSRYERTKDLADLTDAVDKIGLAFGLTRPDDPLIYMYGVNLGAVLIVKYQATGAADSLDAAIQVLQIVVDDKEPGPDRRMLAAAQATLGTALSSRHDQAGAPADLAAAQKACLRAIELTPEDDVRRGSYRASLASILWSRARLTGDEQDRTAALTALEAAAGDPLVPTSIRISSAEVAASMHAAVGDWHHAAGLLAAAVRLIPLTVPRQLLRTDQEHWLGRFTDLGADAAACAINADDAEGALVSLEAGRGILLALALQLRGAVADLRATARDLADEFERIRVVLDAPAPQLGHLQAGSLAGTLGAFDRDEALTTRRRELVARLGQLTAEIRELPGFASFMAPPSLAALGSAAANGPVVFLNVSRYGSDALILTASGIRPPIRLPGLTPELVAGKVGSFLTAVQATGRPDPQGFEHAQRIVAGTLAWLWEAVAAPVLDDLGFSRATGGAEPLRRVWWSPTGLLSYLPVHAAGPSELGAPAVLDRVISSYTPTAYALLESRKRERGPDSAQSLLVVAMPQTPGAADLSGAGREAERLAARFPTAQVLGTWAGANGPATHDSVLSALPHHAFAHFSCHGMCDMTEPAHSLLAVSDHEDNPLTIADIAGLSLDQAQLAYLSACETAQTGPRLTNEAQHMVIAFCLAGYPHVIGTLWQVSDSAAVSVADDVYAQIAPHGQPIQATRSAAALHAAVRELRDRFPDAPTAWAAHIHVGA